MRSELLAAGYLLKVEELDVEDQSRAGRDDVTEAPRACTPVRKSREVSQRLRTVSQVRRDGQDALLIHAHTLKALVPALDDLPHAH